jgi:hypothetical protein
MRFSASGLSFMNYFLSSPWVSNGAVSNFYESLRRNAQICSQLLNDIIASVVDNGDNYC